MNELTLLEIARESIMTMLLVLGPLLVSLLVVGLLVSIVQAVTQVNEATLVFVPKLAIAFIVLLVAGPWMADNLMQFTVRMFTMLPLMAR